MGRGRGRVALVSGAARRQDWAHAVQPAEFGADIVAMDPGEQIQTVRNRTATLGDPDKIAGEAEGLGQRVLAWRADVPKADALRAALATGQAEVGPVDVLVAGSGAFATGPSDAMAAQTS